MIPPAIQQRLILHGMAAFQETLRFQAQILKSSELALLAHQVTELSSTDVSKSRLSSSQTTQDLKQQLVKAKQLELALRQQLQQEQGVANLCQQISRLHNQEHLSNFVVTQVQQLLNADRTVLYQFNDDWSGTIVAEAVAPEWVALKEMTIEDCCFKGNYVQYYREGRIRVIDNVHDNVLAPCHVELLTRFQVKANVVLPVLLPTDLWGLLIVHQCSAPRQWQKFEIGWLELIAAQLALGIKQAAG